MTIVDEATTSPSTLQADANLTENVISGSVVVSETCYATSVPSNYDCCTFTGSDHHPFTSSNDEAVHATSETCKNVPDNVTAEIPVNHDDVTDEVTAEIPISHDDVTDEVTAEIPISHDDVSNDVTTESLPHSEDDDDDRVAKTGKKHISDDGEEPSTSSSGTHRNSSKRENTKSVVMAPQENEKKKEKKTVVKTEKKERGPKNQKRNNNGSQPKGKKVMVEGIKEQLSKKSALVTKYKGLNNFDEHYALYKEMERKNVVVKKPTVDGQQLKEYDSFNKLMENMKSCINKEDVGQFINNEYVRPSKSGNDTIIRRLLSSMGRDEEISFDNSLQNGISSLQLLYLYTLAKTSRWLVINVKCNVMIKDKDLRLLHYLDELLGNTKTSQLEEPDPELKQHVIDVKKLEGLIFDFDFLMYPRRNEIADLSDVVRLLNEKDDELLTLLFGKHTKEFYEFLRLESLHFLQNVTRNIAHHPQNDGDMNMTWEKFRNSIFDIDYYAFQTTLLHCMRVFKSLDFTTDIDWSNIIID